jgi:hypothetical protein
LLEGRIPLFDGEKQQKTPVQAHHRPNATFQVFDSISTMQNSATLPNSGILAADQGNYLA